MATQSPLSAGASGSPPPLAPFLAELRAILGDSYVLFREEDVEPRARTLIPRPRRPVAYVYPASADEVRQVLLAANRHKVPLWTCSRGRNWGYGTATPAEDGAVVMVLERMNRIEEVNPDLAYAVLEPGVTYRQLNDYLKDRDIPLWCDCTDGTPHGSVIGNALEKGIGLTPYGDHFGNLCGLDVVFPDGRTMRTGGGPENLRTRHTYKWGTGPGLEGLFAQSNYGVVVRAGVWLMPRPKDFRSVLFTLRRDEDLPQLVDTLRGLALSNVLQAPVHLMNDIAAFTMCCDNPAAFLQGKSGLDDTARAAVCRRYGLAPWTFATGLYGSRGDVRAKASLLRKHLSGLGRLDFLGDRAMARYQRLTRVRSRPGRFLLRRVLGVSPEILEGLSPIHGLLQGRPTEHFLRQAYYKSGAEPATDVDPARDRCGLIWCAPVAPLTGEDVTRIRTLAEPLFRRCEFDFYLVLLVVNPRSVVTLMSIFYRRDDPDETRRALDLYEDLCRHTLAAGYQQYRTQAPRTQILDCDPDFRGVANRIKAALDPNGILAPGRYGVYGADPPPPGIHGA